VTDGTSTPVISVDAASTTSSGIVQLYNGTDSTSTTLAATANAVKTAFDLAGTKLPLDGGTMNGDITFAGTQTFPGTLPLAGGAMTGNITFNAGQTFPGVIAENAIGATDPINVGGTASNPIISVDIATASALGVVQPDGTTITVTAGGVISAVGSAGIETLTADLPLVAGGTATDVTLGINAATTSALGVVQPDGTTITVSPTGVISSVPSSVPPPDYGNFYSDNTQQPQALITGQPVTLNQTVAANNFQIIDGSKVTAAAAGVYNLQFSIQLVSTNQGGDVEIWLAKNGVAVDESNTYFHTKNPNEAEFAALNYVETLASGDYLELIWATDNLNMTLAALPSTMGGPNIPSVILTIVPVGA
jgi:hypothetical protein